MRLGNRRIEDSAKEMHLEYGILPLNDRALNSLDHIVHHKDSKNYAASLTWIVIRNAFFLWSMSDYEEHRHEIFVPESHRCDQIWILFDNNTVGKRGIMRLK